MSAADAEPQRRHVVRRNAFVYEVSKWLLRMFLRVWCRLRAEHAERVPGAGPVLLVANHASYLDPPLSGVCLRRWVAFLARASLAKVPGLRWWMAKVGVTLIDREAPSKDALRAVADCLAAGQLVCIFPEGTRSPDGSVGPFRSGVEFLVRRTGALVVPCGIDGSGRAFPKGAWLPRPRRIVVRYGEPWLPEKVLADGGVEALRATVAELARAPLRERRSTGSPAPRGSAEGSEQNASAAGEASASPTATDSRMVRRPGL